MMSYRNCPCLSVALFSLVLSVGIVILSLVIVYLIPDVIPIKIMFSIMGIFLLLVIIYFSYKGIKEEQSETTEEV